MLLMDRCAVWPDVLHDVMGGLHQYFANVIASINICRFRNISVLLGEFDCILPRGLKCRLHPVEVPQDYVGSLLESRLIFQRVNILKLSYETFTRCLKMFDEFVRVTEEKRLGKRHSVGLAIDNQRQVEQVTGCCLIASVEHFLCNNLCRCFNEYAYTEQIPAFKSMLFGQQIRCCNEIDFPCFQLKLDIQRCFHVLRITQGFRDIAQAWRHVRKALRVRNEEIDILAHPVPITKHQDGAAAKGKKWVGTATVLANFIHNT